MADNITITNAISLWQSFCGTARFNDSQYDADLERQVRKALKLPATGQISSLLKKNAISTENLLAALLNAMQPFSQMLNDLLRMFEQASVQYSNVNLKIQFDFDANTQPFQFDLEHFREAAHDATSLIQRKHLCLIKRPWPLIDAFDIFHCQDFRNLPRVTSTKTYQWLQEYTEDIWPNFMPEISKTEIESLDQIIKQIWSMVANTISYYKQAYDPAKGRKRSHYEALPYYRDNPIWQDETDSWVGTFIRVATYTIEHMNELALKEKVTATHILESNLRSFIDVCQMTTEEIKDAVDSLKDILNFPFWTKRHELYAAWILAEITDSLKDTGVQFHAPDNMLSFSFRKTRMATCTKLKPPLDIWAELRTEYSSAVSKKRKRHIQPDYTLAFHDAEDINNTVAVIECKQYKKASRKNFLEAIADYAGGRPKAQVFLVNYGPISQKLLDKLKAPLGRSFPFGAVRPGSEAAQNFRKKLLNEVLEYYRKKFKNNHFFMCPWKNRGDECYIQLKWMRAPKDLDLHLRISDATGRIQTVYFSVPGDESCEPYAKLDYDCRSSYGCETIHIVRWIDAEYDVIIDNYSGEPEIDGTIDISILCGSDQYSCSCSKPWCRPLVWHVFHLNSCGFQVINRCIHETL